MKNSLKVIKRDGKKVEFDETKIYNAVIKAFKDVYPEEDKENVCIDVAKDLSVNVKNSIMNECLEKNKKEIDIECIQDLVENLLMDYGYYKVAKAYIKYRYDREKSRVLNKDLEKRFIKVKKLVSGEDEESKKENSNKDTRIVSTMRDYIAGFTCREMAKRIFPKDIWEAHESGIIHIHDTDYSPLMTLNNCGLVDLGDMLQNGTVISETLIERPKSFRTACTIASQIVSQVASSQYGGQSISLSQISPFVDVSRKKYKKEVMEDCLKNDIELTHKQLENIVERKVKKEIKDGIQTLQYQFLTLSTTNGQAPFITVFCYLDEVPDGQPRKDLAMCIEEMIKQRIESVKNPQGVNVTTAFPKIIYALDEDNIHEDSEYYWLTKLCAECTSKRLVPDYVSAKVMKENKEGNVFPPMG